MALTLFYKNLTILDYAYFSKEEGLKGNSLHVDVELTGETDDEGVIFDFSLAKKKIKTIIDEICDHRLIVPKGIYKQSNSPHLDFLFSNGQNIQYSCPTEGICELPDDKVTYTNIEHFLENHIIKSLPKTVQKIKILLREENIGENQKSFHYTHGLKDHYGNCQRLFHGHKNIVEVFVDNKKDHSLEEYLCETLFEGHVHFAYFENIVNKEEVINYFSQKKPSGKPLEVPFIHIKYKSAQGLFEAQVPGSHCYIFQSETTVENLSTEFAKIIANKTGKTNIRVHAYEGIAKGSITIL